MRHESDLSVCRMCRELSFIIANTASKVKGNAGYFTKDSYFPAAKNKPA